MGLQTRVFIRESSGTDNNKAAARALTADVNAFLATFSDSSRVRDIQTTVSQTRKYGDVMLFMTTVVYLVER